MAKFILNDDGSFTQEKKRKKQKSKYEELKNVPFTGQSKFKTQSEDKYFKKSKGNTGQAIGYSALDALGNFTEGSLNFFEGMSDSARYAGANVLDFFGADKKAKEIRERARENDVEDIVSQWNHITAGDLSGTKSEKEIGRFKKVEDNSIFGEKSDQVIQGVGNSLTGAAVGSYLGAPITGVGKGADLARNVIGLTSFGSSAAGHATTEAYNEGANDFQAGVYGILNGAVESGSEMLFGGLGKINKSLGFGTGALDDAIVKKLTKNIGNTLARNIATIGLKSAGEGVEEIASLLGNQLVRRMMNMDSKTLKELAEDGTLADTFVQGTLSSLISQTPSGISSTAQGRDYATGLTNTQRKYVNEIAQQRMVEAEKRNAKLRGIEKSRIEDRALTDYQKGRLADANKLEQVNLPGLSTKDMDLQQSAYKYGFNPNSEAIVTAKTMLDNRGIKSRFDADAFKNINGNAYWTNKNGVREVVFNPNASEQAIIEEIAIHELTHDLMSSKNSKDVISNQKIIDYVSTLDGYKESKAKLEKLYSKQTKGMNKQKATDLINEEIVADTLGKNIGSQEYIRRLIDDEPSIAKNIYDWVVNKVVNNKGVKNEKAYWNNVKNNFEKAYNMSYENSKQKNKNTKFSVREDERGNKYVNVDINQNIFEGKTIKEQNKIARQYILDNFRENGLLYNDENVSVTNKTAVKYTDPLEKIPLSKKKIKNKISTELDNLLLISKEMPSLPDKKNHGIARDGWRYFETKFKINGEYYTGLLNVGVNDNTNTLYDVTNIKKDDSNGTDKSDVILNKSSLGDNIAPIGKDVKYSLSETPTQDNQGRELTKEQQEFFKDSKVRDSEGRLLEVYHGTPYGEFTVFDSEHKSNVGMNILGKGFYFTSLESTANEYSKFYDEFDGSFDYDKNSKVYKTYLNIKNPFVYNASVETLKDALGKVGIDYDKKTIKNDLIKKGYDGLIEHTRYSDFNQIVAYNSNQIKNVDNTNPTDDADIRYSQQTEGWQSFLDKNFNQKGTKTRLSDIKLPGLTKAVQEEVQKQTSNALLPIANELKELNKNLTKVMNPSEIAQLTPQDANTTPILPGINRNKVGDGKSKFFDNIKDKTNMLSDETKTAILSSDDVKYYDKVTNKESLDKAYARLQENGRAEVEDWLNKTKQTDGKDARQVTSVDVAEGWILLKQTNDAIEKETDPIRKHQLLQSSVNYAINLRDIGSKAGQVIQAFNILSRLTPEGMVYYAQKELSQAYDEMVKNKTKAWIDENKSKFELQPNEVAFIMDTMKDVSTMEDGYDKRFKLAQIQKVLTDKLPPAKGAGMKAWMRISMLFNPKTQVRNVAGNALIAPVNAFGDMFASFVDKVIGSKTGVRTTGNFNLKDYTSGMKKGLYESYNDFKHGVNTRNIQGNRFEVTEGKSFNDNNAIGKALNKVDNLLSFVLDAGDRGFYEATFVNSINNQLVLNNTTEVTQDMIDIATQEALSRTWQDNNEYTKFVMNMRNELNRFVHFNGYGLGDILIPFAKTPANLTKAIVDYSPVGLVSALNKGIKLNRSLTNGQYNAQTQHEFVQSLGKATAGTILYVLGYALAQAGITSGASDEDKDVSNFLKNTLGKSSYSIQIGGKTFTYDWAQPIAAPLSMMANLVQKEKEGATLAENITTTLDTGLNLLFEQSFLESMSNVFSQPGEIGTKMIDQFLDLPSRAVPTLFKQIADLVDGTQRQTYVKDKPIESMVNEVKAKIPGLSQTLAPSVDTLGREIQKYGGKNNPFNVFLNPANVNTENISKSGQEIYRLYKETGETNIMPRVAPYYVNKKGEKIVLDTKQRAQYQKVSGSIIESNVAKLLELTEYKNMSDKDKASVVNDIVNYSYNIAQNQVLGTELSKEYERAYEYSKIGDISDYYAFTNSVDDTTAKTQRESVFNYLYNSELDDNQIAALYSKYYSTEQKLDNLLTLKIPMRQFIKFDSADIQGEYNPKTGKTISGSKKNAVIRYVNDLEGLSKAQKAIIIKSTKQFKFDNYNNDIIRYVNALNGSVDEKKVLLKSIGFDNYDKDVVRYIQSQGLSQEETEKKLDELGFTVRDGRVYY